MKTAVFNTKSYDRQYLDQANEEFHHELSYFKPQLAIETAKLAFEYEAVCVFVNDHLDKNVLEKLYEHGTRLIALRCAGFNNVDLKVAEQLGLTILRVPAYSPHGVAEHTVALMLILNRKIHRAYNRVREGNFSLEGLLGFDLNGKTVGIVGTGRIGFLVAKILIGFGCQVMAYDVRQNQECIDIGIKYVALDELFHQSDIISLHTPLLKNTYHIINNEALEKMKEGVMIINTSRGGLIDASAVVQHLKSGRIGYLGLDVYEEEDDVVFEDHSDHVIQDDVLARLLVFPNVILTGHQAFFTENALASIAHTTLKNIEDFEHNKINNENVVGSN